MASGNLSNLFNIKNKDGKSLSLFSVDFETTGAISDRSNATQLGFVLREANGSFKETEFALRDSVKKISVSDDERKWMKEQNKLRKANNLPLLTEDDLKLLVNEDDLLIAHEQSGAGAFGLKQKNSGSFKPIVDAYREDLVKTSSKKQASLSGKKVKSLKQALGELKSNVSKSPGIILIQNARFENNVVKSASTLNSRAEGQKVGKNFIRDFNREVYGSNSTDSIFEVSDDVISARKELRQATASMRTALMASNKELPANHESLTRLSQAANTLHSTIYTEIKDNFEKGKSTVVDLMDLTRIYQTKLIENSLIDPALMDMGIKVDFLSQSLGFGKELHLAADDSKKQVKIFEFLTARIDELNNGVINTAENSKYTEALTKNLASHEEQFISGLRSKAEEVFFKLDEELDKGTLKAKDYELEMHRRLRSQFESTLSYYEGVPVREGFDRRAEVEITLNMLHERPKTIQVAPEQTPSPTNPASNVDPLNPSNANAPNNTRNRAAYTIEEKQENILKSLQSKEESAGKFVSDTSVYKANNMFEATVEPLTKNSTKLLKYGLYGIGAMAALNILSKDSNTQVQQPGTYDAIYGNLYLGQGYADWQERNNSHKMIY